MYKAQENLCPEHHRGHDGVHNNKRFDDELKKYHQRRIMDEHSMTFKDWLSIFHKSYI